MTAIVSFIGWHDRGKTELASQVVAHLSRRGYRVAVAKSSGSSDIGFSSSGAAIDRYGQAGAQEIVLIAPDQMILRTHPGELPLVELVHRYLGDADIVIAEGFEQARLVAKIEVVYDPQQMLRRDVHGVIAVATDLKIVADYVFRLNEAEEIAQFVEKRFLQTGTRRPEKAALLVNGRKVVLKPFIQESLAGVVAGYVDALKINDVVQEIEVRIKLPRR